MNSSFRDGKTTRLVPYEEKFAEKFCEWYFDYDYRFFFREFLQNLTEDQFKNLGDLLKRSGVYLVMILDVKTNEPIGAMTYTLEKISAKVYKWGIMLDRFHQHKTWAIDAIIVMCDFLFRCKHAHKTVVEFCDEDEHIHRITQKGGFDHEATLKEEIYIDGKYFDEARYSLSKKQFMQVYVGYLDDESGNLPLP